MNAEELKAAAGRLLSRPGLEDDQWDTLIRNCQQHNSDCYDIGTWVASLLSDAPVTAEWLRDVWGAKILRNDDDGWAGEIECNPYQALTVYSDGTVIVRDQGSVSRLPNAITDQGIFTLLALGLGLSPVERNGESDV